jgi:hypothetical protein
MYYLTKHNSDKKQQQKKTATSIEREREGGEKKDAKMGLVAVFFFLFESR